MFVCVRVLIVQVLLSERVSALGNEQLCPSAAVQTWGDGARRREVRALPVAFTSWHSVVGISLCCCVLSGGKVRGLQGSAQGHRMCVLCV